MGLRIKLLVENSMTTLQLSWRKWSSTYYCPQR